MQDCALKLKEGESSLGELSSSHDITFIQKLKLINFRNYEHFEINANSNSVVLYGKNGVGKTNILESISQLAAGRGLRGVKFTDLVNHHNPNQPFGIHASVMLGRNRHEIAVSLDFENKIRPRKICAIDAEKFTSQTILNKFMSVIWLTPQMDQLFIGPAANRRKFLARLVYNFFPEHAADLNKYEYCQRERIRVLRHSIHENQWLCSLEQKMSEVAVSIASCRVETLNYLNEQMQYIADIFPKAQLTLQGEIEEQLQNNSALQVEENFKQILQQNRALDLQTNRTNAGVHRSDLLVYHEFDSCPAERCSTGEQKALLTSIILAEVKAKLLWHNIGPVLLLDEPATHLDEKRKDALFEVITDLGVQCWVTGTERSLFSFFENKADFIEINRT